MKFRKNSTSKIKYKHSFIKGLKEFLEKIESLDEIKTILPGVINKNKTFGALVFTFQYKTKTGARFLAKSDGAVQEVFIVSDQIDELLKKIKNY
jgi:hypothetical protein